MTPLEGEVSFTLCNCLSWDGDIEGMGFSEIDFEIREVLEEFEVFQ